MVDPVGFRFRPTDEEIVDYYLRSRSKNIDGNKSHVDKVINTVDIYSFDPWELPPQSSSMRNATMLLFGMEKGSKDNKYNGGERQSRKKRSCFLRKTGVNVNMINPTVQQPMKRKKKN
ncbi:unnamed protein product [Eruca vesicaria subsp. sativa]|uniref:NAC domain-containing protein n=1 Tax=Eruca vesicaria subsp. sativa TaxID=29727 RepID=A0ABC8KD73_ERUVS|nr:unnamed protein product [Eruca vesicaria subsp. sativa]